jgi:hypothetical protein
MKKLRLHYELAPNLKASGSVVLNTPPTSFLDSICVGILYSGRYIVFYGYIVFVSVFCNAWVYGICVGILYLCRYIVLV